MSYKVVAHTGAPACNPMEPLDTLTVSRGEINHTHQDGRAKAPRSQGSANAVCGMPVRRLVTLEAPCYRVANRCAMWRPLSLTFSDHRGRK